MEEVRDCGVGGLVHAGRLDAPSSSKVVEALVLCAGEHVDCVLTGQATENAEPFLRQEETSVPLELRVRAIPSTIVVVAPAGGAVGKQ